MKPIHIDLDKLLSISIYSENFFFKPTLLNLINFTYFNNTTNFDLAEDSYENFKAVKLPYLYTSKFLLSSMNNFTPTVSYATNLNLFRADFEESSWFTSNNYVVNDKNSPILNLPNILTNSLRLRAAAKNLMVTYNAIQKVYRSRFDEGRSNMNFSLLSSSYQYYPLLTEGRSDYENILSKNKESFFSTTFYNRLLNSNYSSILNSCNFNNYTLFDIPFLVSFKSDAARYL